MRRLLATSTFMLLAACATRPQPGPPQPGPPQPPPSSQTRGLLIGMTPEQLVRQFGTPALQIREGNSLKLQFRSNACVLDAYLYPPPGGVAPYRVSFVDTRNRAMAAVDQAACVASLARS